MDNLLPIPTNSVNPENAIVCYGLPTPVPVQKPVMQNHSNLVSLTGHGSSSSKGVSKAPVVQQKTQQNTIKSRKNRKGRQQAQVHNVPNGTTPSPLMSLSLPGAMPSAFHPQGMYPMFHPAFPRVFPRVFPKRKKGKKKSKTNSSEKQKPNPINANLVPVNKKPAVSWLSMASANPPPKASEVSDQPSTTKSSLVSVQQKSPVAGTSTLPDKPVSSASIAERSSSSTNKPVTTSLALSTSSAQAAKSKKSQQKSQVLEAKKSTVSKTSHTSTRQPDLKNEKNTYVSDLVMVSQLHETANRKGLVAHFIFLEPSDLEFRFQLNNNNRLVILFFRLQYFIKH